MNVSFIFLLHGSNFISACLVLRWEWDTFLCRAQLANPKLGCASGVVICLKLKYIYSKQDQEWLSYVLFWWHMDISKLFSLSFSRRYSRFCTVVLGLPRSPNCNSIPKPTFIVIRWILLPGFSHFIFIVNFFFSIFSIFFYQFLQTQEERSCPEPHSLRTERQMSVS